MICKLHGFPQSLVSDRDPIFVSRFWRELFTICGTKLRISTLYHPEINGQTEVLSRTLEQYLCCFVHDAPTKWFQYHSLAEWCYNTFVHSSTRITPFEPTYGKPPPSIPHYLLGSSSVDVVDYLMSSRHDLWTSLKNRLLKVQRTMKAQADAKCCDYLTKLAIGFMSSFTHTAKLHSLMPNIISFIKDTTAHFKFLNKLVSSLIAQLFLWAQGFTMFSTVRCLNYTRSLQFSLPILFCPVPQTIIHLSNHLVFSTANGPQTFPVPHFWSWCNGVDWFLRILRGKNGMTCARFSTLRTRCLSSGGC